MFRRTILFLRPLPLALSLSSLLAVPFALSAQTGQPMPSPGPMPTDVGRPSTDTTPTAQPPFGVARASQIIGLPVTDPTGATLGKISNLANERSGLIAVIERPGGGFVALPFNQLTTMGNLSPPSSAAPAGQPITMGAPGPADSTVGIDKLVFLGGQQSLSTAPVLQQPNQMDPSWLQRFHEHFGTNAIGAPPLGGPGEPAIGATGMPPAGRVGEGPVFLGNFLSSGIEDGRGQRLGSVKDVAISLPDGRVAFAVVSTPGADRGSAEVLHGVPFESFQQGVPGTLLLPATPTMFGTSSGLDLNHLPRQPDVNVAVPAMPPRAQPMGPAPNQPGNEPMKPPQKPGAGQAGNPPPNKPENPPAPKPGPKPAPTGPKSSHS